MTARLRILGNLGLIAGQCVLLFYSRDLGLSVLIASSALSYPYFIEERMWDVVFLMSFMMAVNAIGLFFA